MNIVMACQVLGISTKSWQQDYKSAYRNLCKLYHPDNNGGNNIDKYSKVLEAYEYLNGINKSSLTMKTTPPKYFTGRVYGAPKRDVKRPDDAEYRKKREQQRAKRYEELKEEGKALRQKEKEDKIINEIRWIRVADIIRKAIAEDTKRAELEKRIQDEIEKNRNNS